MADRADLPLHFLRGGRKTVKNLDSTGTPRATLNIRFAFLGLLVEARERSNQCVGTSEGLSATMYEAFSAAG
jgi:hypothetical protein